MVEIIETSWDVWNWFKNNMSNSNAKIVGNCGQITVELNSRTIYFEHGDLLSSIKKKIGE